MHSPTSIEFHTKGLSAAQTPSDTCTRSFPPGFDQVDVLPPLPASLHAALPATAPSEAFPAVNPHIIFLCSTLPRTERLGRELGRKESAGRHGETSSRRSNTRAWSISPWVHSSLDYRRAAANSSPIFFILASANTGAPERHTTLPPIDLFIPAANLFFLQESGSVLRNTRHSRTGETAGGRANGASCAQTLEVTTRLSLRRPASTGEELKFKQRPGRSARVLLPPGEFLFWRDMA